MGKSRLSDGSVREAFSRYSWCPFWSAACWPVVAAARPAGLSDTNCQTALETRESKTRRAKAECTNRAPSHTFFPRRPRCTLPIKRCPRSRSRIEPPANWQCQSSRRSAPVRCTRFFAETNAALGQARLAAAAQSSRDAAAAALSSRTTCRPNLRTSSCIGVSGSSLRFCWRRSDGGRCSTPHGQKQRPVSLLPSATNGRSPRTRRPPRRLQT